MNAAYLSARKPTPQHNRGVNQPKLCRADQSAGGATVWKTKELRKRQGAFYRQERERTRRVSFGSRRPMRAALLFALSSELETPQGCFVVCCCCKFQTRRVSPTPASQRRQAQGMDIIRAESAPGERQRPERILLPVVRQAERRRVLLPFLLLLLRLHRFLYRARRRRLCRRRCFALRLLRLVDLDLSRLHRDDAPQHEPFSTRKVTPCGGGGSGGYRAERLCY